MYLFTTVFTLINVTKRLPCARLWTGHYGLQLELTAWISQSKMMDYNAF